MSGIAQNPTHFFILNTERKIQMRSERFDTHDIFSTMFHMMKIKYYEYGKSISAMNFVQPTDKINVFINMEAVLRYISTISHVDEKIMAERDFSTILESGAINLCAHYKRFFREEGLETRVFMYYTNLESDEFDNFKYNNEYRSFYMNKFTMNPRFKAIGEAMIDDVDPNLTTTMQFIPGINFISCIGIEGSIIPLIIANSDPTYKNFIITTDMYESQYQLLPNQFCVHIIRRSNNGTVILDNLKSSIWTLLGKDYKEKGIDISILTNPTFYNLVLSADGDKERSIESLKGIGRVTMLKLIHEAINRKKITPDTTSLDMVLDAIHIEKKDILENSFKCTDIFSQYKDLTEVKKHSILNQVVDRFDYNSIITLNQTKYKDYPLMLQELTM